MRGGISRWNTANREKTSGSMRSSPIWGTAATCRPAIECKSARSVKDSNEAEVFSVVFRLGQRGCAGPMRRVGCKTTHIIYPYPRWWPKSAYTPPSGAFSTLIFKSNLSIPPPQVLETDSMCPGKWSQNRLGLAFRVCIGRSASAFTHLELLPYMPVHQRSEDKFSAPNTIVWPSLYMPLLRAPRNLV